MGKNKKICFGLAAIILSIAILNCNTHKELVPFNGGELFEYVHGGIKIVYSVHSMKDGKEFKIIKTEKSLPIYWEQNSSLVKDRL